jgi:RNAse (barnase) inhibitor barstar
MSEEVPEEIPILVLDARDWKQRDDVYESFFKAVGAPEWHGRNLDALHDSIATGCINQIETPYVIVIKNYRQMGDGARPMAKTFVEYIRELEENGTDVSVRVESD